MKLNIFLKIIHYRIVKKYEEILNQQNPENNVRERL